MRFRFRRAVLVEVGCLFLAAAFFCGCARTPCGEEPGQAPDAIAEAHKAALEQLVPEQYRAAVAKSLGLAGENAEALVAALREVSPDHREAAAFLVANMPPTDLALMRADVLVEHVEYAYKARETLFWGETIPEDVFLHYVLPYRCSEEPIEKYRRYFYEQLYGRVRELRSVKQAAHEVNVWLGRPNEEGSKRVRFVQTEARDQGPLETLMSGYGRCEEMMITYMSAARSVCVPARSVWTPWWATGDGNHAWVEVWADGQWYPLGGCEPGREAELKSAWFSKRARRVGVILSAVFGVPEGNERLCQKGERSAILNITDLYSRTSTVRVRVLSREGEPAAGVPVSLSVVNHGAFRAFRNASTGEDGAVSFTTGIGDFLAAAGREEARAWAVVHAVPEETVELTLRLEPGAAPDGFLWLRYPLRRVAESDEELPESLRKRRAEPSDRLDGREADWTAWWEQNRDRLAVPEPPPEQYCVKEFKLDEHPALRPLIGDNEGVINALKDAAGNWEELAAAIREVPDGRRADLLWLITIMPHLDRLECDAEQLLDHVNYAHLARQEVPYEVPEELFRSDVLNYQLRHVHIGAWRRFLFERMRGLIRETVRDTALAVNRWIQENIRSGPGGGGRFKLLADPRVVCRRGWGSSYELSLMATGALRTLGLPARLKKTWVEFYDGEAWLPFYPLDPARFAMVEKDVETQREYGEPGGLTLSVTLDGKPQAQYRHFALSQFSDGAWNPLRSLRTSGSWIVLPEGNYLVTLSRRNRNGDSYVFARSIDARPERGLRLSVNMDIPFSERGGVDRTVRELPESPDFELTSTYGEVFRLSEVGKDSSVLLVFFTLENEPSIRMVPMIEGLASRIRETGTELLGILVDAGGADKLAADSRMGALTFPVLLDEEHTVAKQFIPRFEEVMLNRLPSILLLDREGELVLWEEGYDLGIADTITGALALLSGEEAIPAEVPEQRYELTEVAFKAGPDYSGEGLRLLQQGKYEESIAAYLKALELNPESVNDRYNLACAYSLKGEVDAALEQLSKAIELGWTDFGWMKKDPDLENVRKDPRFAELLQ